MKVYQIYDQATDAYTAWAANSERDAIAQYLAENPPELYVTRIWPLRETPVEGDDVLRFPIGDWRREVFNGESSIGYAEWLAARLTIDFEGI